MLQITFPCGVVSYTQQKQDNSVAQMACRSLYDLCTGAERIPGSSRGIRWNYPDVVR